MGFATAPDGVRLYYGDGQRTTLLVAGQGSDHRMWQSVVADFAQDHRVIVHDHRGTGQSDKPEAPPYSTRACQRDRVAILDDLGIDRAHAYGVSMAGRIC